MSDPIRRVRIPLESRPDIAALVGFVIGHSSLMSAQYDYLFSTLNKGAESSDESDGKKFQSLSQKDKRKRLKQAAENSAEQGLLSQELYETLRGFLDNTLAPLAKRRNDLAHQLFLSGKDEDLSTLNTKQESLKDLSLSEVETLFNDFAVANGQLQDIWIAVARYIHEAFLSKHL